MRSKTNVSRLIAKMLINLKCKLCCWRFDLTSPICNVAMVLKINNQLELCKMIDRAVLWIFINFQEFTKYSNLNLVFRRAFLDILQTWLKQALVSYMLGSKERILYSICKPSASFFSELVFMRAVTWIILSFVCYFMINRLTLEQHLQIVKCITKMAILTIVKE